MNIIDWILYIPLVFCVCYLLLYAIASKFYRAPQYPEARTLRRIVVLFPAYKEDRVIVASIQSFLEQDYPKELYEIIVISDQMRPETNDALAALPIRLLMANYKESSKAKALAMAMDSIDTNAFDIVVIMDADNMTTPDFLSTINRVFDSGIKSVQAHRTGTTIKQKERSINFTERSYLTVLQSYNEALLRKKNLEMTSATLKVLNEPTYPIASNSTNRKQIVIAACIGSFLIIIALLLLIEILDRTLRDANRTKRVTGFKVIGAVPSPSSSRYGGLTKTYVQLSIKELSNSLLRFLTKRKSPGVFIINLFSTSENSGEDIVGNLICGYMQSRMLNTRFITYGEDFNTDSTQYLLAKNITDFYTLQGEDILIVAYPPLSSSNIPTALLNDANANILVSPADRGWKTIDKQLCEQLTTQMGKTDVPFRVCLTNAKREAVEDFTGQLPPYTLLRRVSYRFSQLSLTEKIIFNLSRKAKETEEDDDE